MTRTDPSGGMVAAGLLLLVAGFVDAVAFIYLQANFVSFMSGNTTVMGVSPSLGHWSDVAVCAGLIALFFVGVFLGSVVNRTRRRPREFLVWTIAAATTVGAVLVSLEPVAAAGDMEGAGVAGMLVVAVATGMINAIFEKEAAVPYGLTYITGTLVRSARQLADTVVGETPGRRWSWLGSLGMWSLLAVGAVGGGYCYRWMSLPAMWIPATLLAAMALTISLARVARPTG
ncbi:YoaK family protein [Gordonia sp. LSe1-13]|uniref:YoaK family protein n=1 Tax=Gordonia sesuvii TaxID=3116777 RepID=A0ABU7MJK7_9ACTN|nr:YoaK family protein [Gordonia sp. LSe1-13]